ncbi:MAG: hypothetical protein ACPGOV_15920 [Magnetovibrionaceae bacterium]
MYLNLLNQEQKALFLGVASQLARADGIVVSEESSVISALQTELGWDVKAVTWTQNDLGSLKEVFAEKRAQVVMLMELYLLALCDGHLPPEELEIFDILAKVFGFSDADCEATLSWARTIAPHVVQGWRMALSANPLVSKGPIPDE